MNQAKENKAQERCSLSGPGRYWGRWGHVLLFYFLHVTARKNGLKPSTGSQKKKSRFKLNSLEQKEVMRSHFVPPQIGSTY